VGKRVWRVAIDPGDSVADGSVDADDDVVSEDLVSFVVGGLGMGKGVDSIAGPKMDALEPRPWRRMKVCVCGRVVE